MRIALIYPPPWKIPLPGGQPDAGGDGPPAGQDGRDLGGDFHMIPYGLLSLAAQAMRRGHEVVTLNLSNFAWPRVAAAIERLDADLFGLSCFTANRRGVDLAARCIRELHPAAHIVVGGPHVTALPRETLQRYAAIDTVVVGEGEETFLELIDHLGAGRDAAGVAGLAWRAGGRIELGPPRRRIDDLDRLASVHDYFGTHMLLTSRGCPGRCTFCASNVLWGRKVRFHSPGRVLESMAKALARLPLKMLAIKDDTFAADRRRALEICRGIVERKLNVLWSCDTRADVLDAELLEAMRRAGCQRLSLGVESASPEVLRNIRKDVAPEQVLEATRLAKRLGFQVRYYMMVGNRGETMETFRRSLEFIRQAGPDDYCFSLLSFYPGTEEFALAERRGEVTAEVFFRGDFKHLSAFADASPATAREIGRWFAANGGVRACSQKGVEECRAALAKLPDLHAAHMDLGGACIRAGLVDEGTRHVLKALAMGYPLPGIGYNYLAVAAAARGDLDGLKANLLRARDCHPHQEVLKNIESFNAFLRAGGPGGSRHLRLVACQQFELTIQAGQPIMPGELPDELPDGSRRRAG